MRIARQQYLGLAALLLVLAGGVYAATGRPVLLGQVNTAGSRTLIENTGSGPALQLRNNAGSPPLRVNSSKRVAKLNASLLGGKRPKAFAAAGSSFTRAESDAKYAAVGASYTKSESDAQYPPIGSSYTKAESDAKYPLATNVYSKSQADAIFQAAGGVQVLAVDYDFTTGDGELVLDQAVSVPGPGTVIVTADAQCTVDNDSTVSMHTHVADTTSSTTAYGPNQGTSLVRMVCRGATEQHFDVAGAANVSATVDLINGSSVGYLTAVAYFVPD